MKPTNHIEIPLKPRAIWFASYPLPDLLHLWWRGNLVGKCQGGQPSASHELSGSRQWWPSGIFNIQTFTTGCLIELIPEKAFPQPVFVVIIVHELVQVTRVVILLVKERRVTFSLVCSFLFISKLNFIKF